MKSEIKLSNGKVVYKPQTKKWVYTLIFFLLIALSIFITDFDLNLLVSNFSNFVDTIIKMLPPLGDMEATKEYFSNFSEIFPKMIETLQMSIVGTLIGTLVAYPVAVLASKNISQKYMSVVIKFILSLSRTLPVLVYAMILTYIFGLGEFAGVVAISIFSFGIVTKMIYEIIERVDMGAYEAAISSGATRYNAFNLTIKPQIMPAFYSISLYTLEINFRSATILGYVGAGGIGKQLQDAMAWKQYDKAGLIILMTMVVVLLIDGISRLLRRRLK